jgi:exonuclease III
MITISWNCRGLAQSFTVRSLMAIIRKHNPDVLFLTKTKTAPHLAGPILNQLGFVMMIQAPPSCSKEGLLLAWKTDINLVSLFVSSNIISVWCYSVDPTVKCLFSFVYGPPYKKTNSDFCIALANFGYSYSDHWICIGDFNAISSSDDKLGGRPFDYISFNPFNDFMDAFGMVDLGFSGNHFTWFNHRQGFDLIKERLDRSIANSQWIHFFSNYSVTHLPAHNSDHNPLLLDTSIPSLSLPRPFRFEEFWTCDPTCGIVIEEAWSSFIIGSPSYCFAKKLKLTKSALNFGISTILATLRLNWIILSLFLILLNRLLLLILILLWSHISRIFWMIIFNRRNPSGSKNLGNYGSLPPILIPGFFILVL